MSKSARLRSRDWHSILRLAGECRELGDERNAWRRHLAEGLARPVDADLGFCGEVADCQFGQTRNMGLAVWGWENGFDRALFEAFMVEYPRSPRPQRTVSDYCRRLGQDDGICLARTDYLADRSWYASADYELQLALGADHVLLCYRALAGVPAEFSALPLHRAAKRRDFGARDRVVVREAHAALAPLVGGPLARFADPSPADLAPRVRQVLACLLKGDGDKQVAARLRISLLTVNQYNKLIYRHFGVHSRPELLARWLRQGWRSRFPWMS